MGKSWTTRHNVTMHSSNKVLVLEWSCKVEAFEKVVVRAGAVDAFRVHCTTNDDTDQVYWHSPEVQPLVKTRFVRGPRSPYGPGTQETELLTRPS